MELHYLIFWSYFTSWRPITHTRHNYNLPKWVAFTDLAKAFDTSNYTLLISILENYGAPPKLCSEIKRMYDKILAKLIIGNIETSIDFKVGAKQGDSMAPVIFLLLMIAFYETLNY